MHPWLNQNGTATTRYAGSDPNPQNVSEREEMPLRDCFGPVPGTFRFDADYSNIELRLWAYDSGEKAFIKAFEQGLNVHANRRLLHPKTRDWTDAEVKAFAGYKSVKNGNFSTIYGASDRKADATYKVPGATALIRKNFTRITAYSAKLIAEAKANGYISTMFGYRLYVPRDRPTRQSTIASKAPPGMY